jgi:hypothetical protein
VEPPPSRVGNPEASRDLEGGPPPRDITRALQKIKLSDFVGGRASECAKAVGYVLYSLHVCVCGCVRYDNCACFFGRFLLFLIDL